MRRNFVPLCLCWLLMAGSITASWAEDGETDPSKCAMVNLAHFYLKCAQLNDLYVHLLGKSSGSAEVRKAVKVTEQLKLEFIQVAFNL